LLAYAACENFFSILLVMVLGEVAGGGEEAGRSSRKRRRSRRSKRKELKFEGGLAQSSEKAGERAGERAGCWTGLVPGNGHSKCGGRQREVEVQPGRMKWRHSEEKEQKRNYRSGEIQGRGR